MTTVDVTSTEMWFSIIPPPPSINLSLHCLLHLLPFSPCLFLHYLQSLYHLYLAPHFSLIFFFSFCVSFLFLFDPSVKPPPGHPSQSPCWCDYAFAPQWRWAMTSQALTSLFIFFSQLQPYLATQPCCFSSLSISSCKGQPERPRVRGINRYRRQYS